MTPQTQDLPLADIHLPIEPSLFPLSMWGNLLLVTILVVLVLLSYIFYRTYAKNRARRLALVSLSSISREDGVGKINAILKRVAISYNGRSDVAALSGHEWFSYLDACMTKKRQSFCEQEKLWLDALYRGSELSESDFNACKAQAKEWIKHAKFTKNQEIRGVRGTAQ